ncbi:cupin domain-containing protein [Lysinibacillus sp.]|uniref:cupin domain-containing protein n=1 Tax=Lysinibacillus sp. TaxID=1869345 RepID=UPI0028B039CC|nr:cupin domain-containing protein [Lysinibacillus sp.]
MKRIQFTQEVANEIIHYNSVDAFYRKIMKTEEPTSIGLIFIEPGGVVGMHEAPIPQLFIVVQGEGWVCGEDGEKMVIKTGEGVLWQQGQAHESGSMTGLTALVIQAEHLHLT